MSSGRHSANVLSTIVGYSLAAMVKIFVVISHMIREKHGIQRMPCYSRNISEILPEIHSMKKKNDFLKRIIHSQII